MGDVNSLRPGGSGDASGSRDNLLRGGLFVDGVVFLTEFLDSFDDEAVVSNDNGGPRESDRLRRRSDLDRGGVYAVVVVVAGASRTCGLDDDNGGLIITSSLGFDEDIFGDVG